MPVTKSTEYAKFDTIGLKKRPDSIQAEGRLRVLNDVVVFDGDESADNATSLLPLPKGAMVDLIESKIVNAAVTSGAVDLGCNGEADNLTDGLDVSAGGVTPLSTSATRLVKVTDGALTLTLKAGSPAASAEMLVSVAYYIR